MPRATLFPAVKFGASATQDTLVTASSRVHPCAIETAYTALVQNLENAFVTAQRTPTARALIYLPGRESCAQTACKGCTYVTNMPPVHPYHLNSAVPVTKVGLAMGRRASLSVQMSTVVITANVLVQMSVAVTLGGQEKNVKPIAAATFIRRVRTVSANVMNASTTLAACLAITVLQMRGVSHITVVHRVLATVMARATQSLAYVIVPVRLKVGTATDAWLGWPATPAMVVNATTHVKKIRTGC